MLILNTMDDLEKMIAEFQAKGGQVQKLEPTSSNGWRQEVAMFLGVQEVKRRDNSKYIVWDIEIPDKGKMSIMTRSQDRVRMFPGRYYTFSFKAHASWGTDISIPFVSRGKPVPETKISHSPRKG